MSPDNDVQSAVERAVSVLKEEHSLTVGALEEELNAVQEYHTELRKQLKECCEQGEQFLKYRLLFSCHGYRIDFSYLVTIFAFIV